MALRILFFVFLATLTCCNSRKFEALQRENDSLAHALESKSKLVDAFIAAAPLLDSIDASRKVSGPLFPGPIDKTLSFRLSDVNKYIKHTESKMYTIERELRSSRNEALAYLMMADAMKGEVEIGVKEIEALEDSVMIFQDVTGDLSQNVTEREIAMNNLHARLKERETQLVALEQKIHGLVRITEAEAYYARAKSVEQNAAKIKLAPARKRDTYREALELYRKAYSLGKQEAREDILKLEKSFGQGDLVAANHSVAD